MPDLVGTPGAPEAPFGAIEFILLGPLPTDWLNYVRSIAATHQDSRWEFTATGTVQPYEDLAAYRRRRVVDRFTPQMLAAYCAELGVRPFDASFYGPRSLLLTSPSPGIENGMVVPLAEAQRLQGIRRPS